MKAHEPVTVAFATLGCKLNQVESQELQGLLEARGYRAVSFGEPAQVYVINTCTVTARADYSDRQMIRRAIARNPNALIVATGCYAQMDPAALARIPGVDLVLGHQEKYSLADLLESLRKRSSPVIRVGEIREARAVPRLPVSRPPGRPRAFVKVQDGCRHRCAFCIVPYARGGSRSRDPSAVVEQVQQLVESGALEVVLTGVDLGHYGRDLVPRTTLAALVARVATVPRLRRLRLSSVLPSDMSPELIEVVTTSQIVCPHFHISLQSGSDRVLQSMRRPYNTICYTSLVEKLSEVIPDLGLGSDMIAGFPGESDAEFRQSVALIQALPFSYLHVFSYCERKGTEAARLDGRLPPRVIAERSRTLRALARAKNLAFRERLLGRSVEVLVLETRDRSTGLLAGLTGNYVRILFDGPSDWMGRLVNVTVINVRPERTLGRLTP